MTIEQAIEKSIEGGYKWNGGPRECSWGHYDHAFLDPLFWQSLGKALGWAEEVKVIHSHPVESDIVREKTEGWKWEWHRFIDHLAEGKDAESFFESL